MLEKIERLAEINCAGTMMPLGEPLRSEREGIVKDLVDNEVIRLRNDISKGSFEFVNESDRAIYVNAFNSF